MRSAIERDADPQQMIPKLTCLLLKTGQAEFRNSLVARDESKSSFAGHSPWQKVDVYKGQYMARNVAKDDLEAQREALSGHGYSAYSSSGSKTPRRIMSASQPVKVISSRPSIRDAKCRRRIRLPSRQRETPGPTEFADTG